MLKIHETMQLPKNILFTLDELLVRMGADNITYELFDRITTYEPNVTTNP